MRVLIFSTGTDYVETAYSEALKNKKIKYYRKNIIGLYNRFCQVLHIKPLRIIYNFLYFLILSSNGRSEDLMIIYHGLGTIYLVNGGFLDYVRRHNPTSYHVLVVWDTNDLRGLNDVTELKQKVDEIVTHDSTVAKELNVTYYPLFYSKSKEISSGEKNKQLVFFCGEDKGRIDLLKRIAQYFSENYISYEFFCYNSSTLYTDELGIHYIKRMDHDEYVRHLAECSVLLDIVKPGITGQTLRFCEAVIYNTRLLSNNVTIESLVCFDGDHMQTFNKPEDIDLEFVRKQGQVIYEKKDAISPVAFINFLSKNAKDNA